MEDFQFETKIREIVYQISQPTMMRLSDCMRQLDVQQLNIDNLKQQLRQFNETQQNHLNDANRKYSDIDTLQRLQKKLEQDMLKNLQASQQYTSNLKSRIDGMDQDFEQHKNNAQFVINSQLKTQQELDQLAKKQAENTETFNKKIDEFFKDYYTFFVESRNQVNKISKEYNQLSKNVEMHGNQLEQIGIFKEQQIQQNTSLQQRVEWISNEIPQLVNKDFFRFNFDKEEKSRIDDIQLLKCQVQQLQNQVSVYNISFDERMKSFELYEIQYRDQLNSFQTQLNQTIETYQQFYKETLQTLSSQKSIIATVEQYQTNLQDKIQIIVNAQMNVIQGTLNNQITKVKDSITQIKGGIIKDMSVEFNQKLDDIRQKVMTELTQQITSKLGTLEQQLNSLKNQTIQKDVAVQVIIDENSISQQEQLQNFIIDQIETRLANVSPKTPARPAQRRNSLVRQEIPQKIDNQKLSVFSNELEDIRTDIQLLFEMREEFEEKFKVFEADFSVGMQNFDRNHSQVLKLKSDIFNDTEYLNNQTKILFREKETTNRKFNYILQLLAGQAETAQIILSFLLRQLKDPIKFTSDLGVVFEQRNEICNYRQSTYQVEDLLKKCFQALIDFWDKNEMLEAREFYPLWYFNKYVVKQVSGLSKTLDKSLERTIKCTTQTMAEGDESIRRSGRQRNFSQKQQTTIDSSRHRKMTVRSMFKQQDESNDGLPKMRK